MINEADARAMIGALLGADVVAPGDGTSLSEWALRNVVAIRLSERFPGLAELARAASAERARVTRFIRVIERLSSRCDELRLTHVLIKAASHLPDMGHDIDLLVRASPDIDGSLLAGMGVKVVDQGTFNVLSGKRAYDIGDAIVEIQHGRIGQIGERRAFAQSLLDGAIRDAGSWPRPRPEAQLVLQAVQRVLAHRTIRAADVVQTAHLVAAALDWREVDRLSKNAAAGDALAWYLGAVDRIHREATGRPLLAGLRPIDPPPFDGTHYRISITRIVMPAFGHSLIANLLRGDLDAAARIAVLPPIAGIALVRARRRR